MKVFGFSCIALVLLIVGCATSNEPSVARNECDVSWVGDSSLSSQRACALRALAKRCVISDRCQIQCEAKGGLPNIGGGCAHVCQGGGAAQTDDDMANNGGPYDTPESIACYNQQR